MIYLYWVLIIDIIIIDIIILFSLTTMLRTEKEADCIPKEVLVKWMVKEEPPASKKKCKHEGKPGKLSAETT